MIAFLFSLVSAMTSPEPSAAAAIARQNASFVAAYERGDAREIALHFEENAVLVSSGTTVRGRTAIESFMRAAMSHGLPTGGACTTTYLSTRGSKSFEVGSCRFTFASKKGPIPYSYTYVAIWNRQPDGRWLLSTDASE